MKILFSLSLLFFSFFSFACGFTAGHKPVYSLSGPLTVYLEELGLLSSPVLKGISIFYPAPPSFKGDVIPGGVFLSPGKLSSMKNSLVFYDGSQELRKLFRSQKIEAIEFVSRNQTPREVTVRAMNLLGQHLSGCDGAVILKKLGSVESEIQKKMKSAMGVIFFLGRISGKKLPELVIANDGLVYWLRKMNLVTTYPSDLAYVNWSGAIINNLKGSTILVGISEGKTSSLQAASGRFNLVYPGALIPGIRQLEAWNYFLNHFEKVKLQ